MQAAQGKGAESARITQAFKGSGGGVSRFHLIGNEEPLKDFKSSQDALPRMVCKEASPRMAATPRALCLAKVRQSPASQRMTFPVAYISPQSPGNVCWPVTPHALNSNKCNTQPICHRPSQRHRKERRAGKVKCCPCRCNVLMLIAGKAVNLPFPAESNSNATWPGESG